MLAAAPIACLVTFAAKGPGFQEMKTCSLFVNLRKGMQSSSEQPLVGEEHCVTTLITPAKETSVSTTVMEVLQAFVRLFSLFRLQPARK